MNGRVSRLTVALAACGFAVVVWLCRHDAIAQEKKPAPGLAVPRLAKLYYGTSVCAGGSCHEKGHTADPPLLCRCDELDRWKEHDKHADAYKVLLGDRGRQMLMALKLDLKDPAQAHACLSCHAVVPEAGVDTVQFRVEEGVSCVACHGAFEPWVGAHSLVISRDKFRFLPPAVKESRYGMTNLWDPVRRSKLCASCHVGSAAEGKVVTHEMYAAGHPPLPGFEVASFSDQMPRHWQHFAEKPPAVQDMLRDKRDRKDRERAKLVLVGAAVSLAEYMRLVAAGAAKKELDWAHFDCYSCHHELKSPAWRQARGYPGRPGRVPAKTWPAELVRLALTHLGEDPAEFEKLWGEAQAAFVVRQFGDAPRVARAAAALAGWADKLAARLNDSAVDGVAAARLLARLPSLSTTPDYDSARQLGWAYRAIWDEHSPKKEPPAALKELSAELGLLLPKGRMQPADRDGVIVRDLGPSLRRLNDYDPARFLRLWRGLGAPGKGD